MQMRKKGSSISIVFGLLTGVISFIAFSANLRADDSLDPKFQWVGTSFHSQRVQTPMGEREYDYRVTRYLNEHGDREVAYEFDRNWLMRFLVGQRRSVLIVGRDLDGNDQYDAWFVMGRSGVSEVVDRVATESDGWDVVSGLLQKNHAALANRLLLDVLFSNLSFTGNTVDHFFETIDRNHIDLHDFELRTDRLVKLDKGSPAAMSNYRMISEEWEFLGEEIQKKQNSLWKWIALDVTVVRLSSYLVQWLDRLNIWTGGKLAMLQTSSGVVRVITEHMVGLSKKAQSAMKRVNAKLGKGNSRVHEIGARAALLKMTSAQRLDIAIRGMKERGKVGRLLGLATEKSLAFGASGLSNWKYITVTQAAQLAIEMNDKKESIFTSSNPLIITKNVVSNKDLVQNVWYMTNETFLMSAAWKTVKNPFKRFGFCAVLSLVDSVAMNYLVKGVTDQKRLALDTAWELTIGNMQTAIVDQKILSYFETRAANLHNPKLKLVGYAGTLLEQSIGYAGYAALTGSGKKEAAPTVRWIPIFAEQTTPALP
ncbi:MAG TPA: hypothetical protein DCS07_13600 [Bdellovibrionales bacterium]|nr:MAG: hypothetical protein A2X97_13150 [Bdellovibrionales bacterium GWA1_52_35]OFZ42941.1 MAG: hypothetical protein A2070_10310 [Bdellovibrionales bacterium GWC1_52_8]HAR43643.1 hypothetical protein [Bdellovibrionales bacterium]HCM39973.1 hypothetical protein [Bdellovibrionales bacterium]